ncbi:methyl-accepting chemotaxis protein [Neobacillus terrae]|uniref:methyl-accepting chemotaxis protein n=1 Tax=Neobacillus terrae TaxID=3034837 RepID=UPI00140E67AE|nr:HAMP domain-containing methyl-accepting chemotaxis protein [Neobacillus terrae]NHM32423.1 methyl-accepting chemotaxis protein [Neobacillus terrae]
MRLKQKILLMSIIPLMLSVVIIAYNIVQLKSLNSSTNEIVNRLVMVETLNGQINSLQKSLSSYSLNMSASNSVDVNKDLDNTKVSQGNLNKNIKDPDQRKLVDRIDLKYVELYKEAKKAVVESNEAEVKRQSLRTKGIINDVYELKRMINIQYEQMQNDLQSKISSIIMFSIIAVVILVIGSGTFSVLLTRNIVNSITRLKENAEEIAQGNLAVNEIEVKGRDEIYSLNLAFQKMSNNLREVIQQVGISATQVAASAEELMASADETMIGTEQITTAIQQVSIGAEQQTSKSKESARAVEETVLGIARIAESVESVSDLSHSTNQMATNGASLVKETLSQMTFIHDSVIVTDEKVKKLHSHSSDIGKIVMLIMEISDQTNLLALNAAIEAARAGESGKGFAVVADEVRKLAEQTRRFSGQISNLVKEIQVDTDGTVKSINDVKEKVSDGLGIAHNTETAFTEILNSMDEIGEQINSISAVSQEISSGSEEVAVIVNEMATVASHTSKNTLEVASASEQQLATMQEVNAASQSLAHLAEELQTTIAKFKL